MTTVPSPARRRAATRGPLLAVAGAVVLAIATQLAATIPAPGTATGLDDEPMLDAIPLDADAQDGAAARAADGVVPVDPAVELAAAREEVSFWSRRLEADPGDLVAAVRLADASGSEARLTGDAAGWTRALAAADAALAAEPRYLPALVARSSALVALHRFAEARDTARAVIERDPANPAALGVLGDASLELGDLAAAGSAYQSLRLVAGGAASLVRDGRLAFLRGDPSGAVAAHEAAVRAARGEALDGSALAFYEATLGETLLATGAGAAARDAFDRALATRPGLPVALAGLARLDAFDGDVTGAIERLDAALAAVPSPDWLALRADLLAMRGGPADAAAAAADHATIEAIASLGDDAGGVYDRSLVRFLADHGLDPARAVRLARAELEVRRDVYGFDALAWALHAAGDASGAAAAMDDALAAGTRDAHLWYHAGVIAAEQGRTTEARAYLEDAMALGPALDPVARERAARVLASVR
jgi:tetratricopeptide (TPR) repeat protein